MSWFKRSPRRNEPAKQHAIPHDISPATERMMEEAKATGPNYIKESKKRKTKSR